jgi:hypothetical protein
MIQKFALILFYSAIFFLPWQTQMILGHASIFGEPSAFGVFSIYVVEAMIVFAFVLLGHRQSNVYIGKTWRAVYFFLGFVFFSLGFSVMATVGWYFVIHLVSAAMFYFLLTDERVSLKKVAIIFLWGLLVPVIVGWYQVLSGTSFASSLLGVAQKDAATLGVSVIETVSGRLLRAHGTFPHPNIFGGYIAVGVVLLVWLTRFVKRRSELVGVLVATVVLGSTLIVTFSRSAWLGLSFGLLLFIGLMYWKKWIPSKQAIGIMALGMISVLATVGAFHQEVLARFTPSLPLETISIEERATQYQQFGSVFLNAPFFGSGPNAYTFTLAQRDPGKSVWEYQPIHNVFLLILGELGVIGFVLFVYLLFTVNPIAHASIKNTTGILAMSLGITLFTISLLDHYMWSLWPGLALTALSGAFIVRWGKDL